MKVYMAARYGRRFELKKYAEDLIALGHVVTSRWLDGTHEAADGDKSRWREFAQDDLDDILCSDTVISFTETQPQPRGSRHVEFGVALALEKKLIVVGQIENVFHSLPTVLQFDNWRQFIASISEECYA